MILDNDFMSDLARRMDDFVISTGTGIKKTLQIFTFRIIYSVQGKSIPRKCRLTENISEFGVNRYKQKMERKVSSLSISNKRSLCDIMVDFIVSDMVPPMLVYWVCLALSAHVKRSSFS